ncbi:transposase [Streptomyces goshikiensis]
MSMKPEGLREIPPDTVRVARAAFPKGSLAIRVRHELGPLFCDEEFADLFPSRGRRAWSPGRLALVLVLQFVEELTDRQAAESVRARIDFKYVLGLELKAQAPRVGARPLHHRGTMPPTAVGIRCSSARSNAYELAEVRQGEVLRSAAQCFGRPHSPTASADGLKGSTTASFAACPGVTTTSWSGARSWIGLPVAVSLNRQTPGATPSKRRTPSALVLPVRALVPLRVSSRLNSAPVRRAPSGTHHGTPSTRTSSLSMRSGCRRKPGAGRICSYGSAEHTLPIPSSATSADMSLMYRKVTDVHREART